MKEATLNGLSAMIEELGTMMEHIVKHMATKDDLAEVKFDIESKMATKEQVFAVQTQVNSIESELRSMKHGRLEVRVADLEEEVFGKIRN